MRPSKFIFLDLIRPITLIDFIYFYYIIIFKDKSTAYLFIFFIIKKSNIFT